LFNIHIYFNKQFRICHCYLLPIKSQTAPAIKKNENKNGYPKCFAPQPIANGVVYRIVGRVVKPVPITNCRTRKENARHKRKILEAVLLVSYVLLRLF